MKIIKKMFWCELCCSNRLHETTIRHLLPMKYFPNGAVMMETECLNCQTKRINIFINQGGE